MDLVYKVGHTFSALLLLLLTGPLLMFLTGSVTFDRDWRNASNEAMGTAPDPATTAEAIIQVYGARTYNWRGAFAVHTWISVKRQNAPSYVTYEVIGWNLQRLGTSLVKRDGPPDRRWYGNEPEVIGEIRGPEVEGMIDRLEKAVAEYPYHDQYRTWPGPNSNTFVAFMGRALPELKLDLPPTAIGKDYIGDKFIDSSPSGTGWQVSFFGLAGIMFAREEGLEINILGLSIGLDPIDLAIKFPGFGRYTPFES